jgi:hypothetical protein
MPTPIPSLSVASVNFCAELQEKTEKTERGTERQRTMGAIKDHVVLGGEEFFETLRRHGVGDAREPRGARLG